MGSLGKEIITEINNENHDVGQKDTIIMAFPTVSDLILDKILGIKLKGGKIYGLIFDQQIVKASTADAPGSKDHEAVRFVLAKLGSLVWWTTCQSLLSI
jgi:hypothetical protein